MFAVFAGVTFRDSNHRIDENKTATERILWKTSVVSNFTGYRRRFGVKLKMPGPVLGLILGLVLLVTIVGSLLWVLTGDSASPEQETVPAVVKERGTNSFLPSVQSPASPNARPRQLVYKPISLKADDGFTAVLEIDHGLRRVDLLAGERYPDAVILAREKGVWGAITLNVVDGQGQVVPDAMVEGAFWNHGKKGFGFKQRTDNNGIVTLQNLCVDDLNFSITKTGYYETRLRYHFSKAGYDCVENNHWAPWNPVIEVALKRIINPAAMYVKPRMKKIFPPKDNVWLGFDFQACAFVAPYGKGKCVDLLVMYEFTPGKNILFYHGAVSLLSTNACDGMYKVELDRSSMMQTAYHANTNAVFLKEMNFVYSRLEGKVETDTRLKNNEYLVMRVRSRTDEEGRLVSAHYLKMMGPIEADDGGVWFAYYFNPNENDTNLEADTMKNLLNPGDLGFSP
jgi:hypothetical protein